LEHADLVQRAVGVDAVVQEEALLRVPDLSTGVVVVVMMVMMMMIMIIMLRVNMMAAMMMLRPWLLPLLLQLTRMITMLTMIIIMTRSSHLASPSLAKRHQQPGRDLPLPAPARLEGPDTPDVTASGI
jgi:hypothetical protein